MPWSADAIAAELALPEYAVDVCTDPAGDRRFSLWQGGRLTGEIVDLGDRGAGLRLRGRGTVQVERVEDLQAFGPEASSDRPQATDQATTS